MVINKNNIEKMFCIILLIIISFLVSMLSSVNPLSNCTTDVDSSVFLYIGKSIYNYKQVPYKDIFDHKGPLLYLINFIGVQIDSFHGVWFIEFILFIITDILLFKISYLITKNRILSLLSTLVTVLTIIPYFERGNYTEEYALPFILMSLFLFVQYIRDEVINISKTKVFIIGASCGCVLMLRQNLIAVWVSYCLIILIYLIKNKKYSKLFIYAMIFLLGNLFIITPFFLYFYYNSALDSFISSYWLFNLKYSTLHENEYSYIIAIYYFFKSTSLILLSFFICIKITFQNMKGKNFETSDYFLNLSSFFYLIINILLISLSGRLYNHYGIVLIPSLIYPISKFFVWISDILSKKNDLFRFLIFIMIIEILSINNIIFGAISFNLVNHGTLNKETMKIISYVENKTSINDEIVVVGNSCSIYLLTNRKAATKYIYQYPISVVDENICTDFINEIMNSKPKLIIDLLPNNEDKIHLFFTNLVNKSYSLDKLNDDIWFYNLLGNNV